ncbi:MAG: hypothetical protein AB7V27_13625, partial [Candidatus Binatia bacterium]
RTTSSCWRWSYRPEELFDGSGRLRPLAPRGERRMSVNPHAKGGDLLYDLRLAYFGQYAVDVSTPGAVDAQVRPYRRVHPRCIA